MTIKSSGFWTYETQWKTAETETHREETVKNTVNSGDETASLK